MHALHVPLSTTLPLAPPPLSLVLARTHDKDKDVCTGTSLNHWQANHIGSDLDMNVSPFRWLDLPLTHTELLLDLLRGYVSSQVENTVNKPNLPNITFQPSLPETCSGGQIGLQSANPIRDKAYFKLHRYAGKRPTLIFWHMVLPE